jgi:hypothetical protein
MIKLKVVKSYKPNSDLFVNIKKDEMVTYNKVFTDKPEWDNWVECKYMNRTCFIPKQYLNKRNNHYYLNRDYNSTELKVSPGMFFIVDFKLNGFAYGTLLETNEKGWVPLSSLEID